jgi:hypothetical protein
MKGYEFLSAVARVEMPDKERIREACIKGNIRKPLPAYFFAKFRRAASNLLARHKALPRRLSLLGKILLRNPSEIGFRMSPHIIPRSGTC